jgi:hypothetical protein
MLRTNLAENSGDTTLMRFLLGHAMLALGLALGAPVLVGTRVSAEAWKNDGDQPNVQTPVFQEHASNGHRREERRDRRDFRRDSRFVSPQISAGWFQRPYPYHLDYYKMRYGGSYAPYFGNLYGTPQVVNYPAYYGPYYGGYGGGYANGYGQPGFGGGPMEYPANSGMMMPGMEVEGEAPGQTQTGESPAKANGESTP